MKRGVFDTLRRGADNSIANWQVSLIRFLEMFLFGVITIIAVIAILVPIFVSVGVHLANLNDPDDLAKAMMSLLEKWVILVWIFVAVSILLLIFIIIHAFVEAGIARVLIDADRVAGPEVTAPRQRFRVFSMQRWMAGAKDGWWEVFWIYNLAWGLAGLLLLIPLIPLALVILLMRETPGPAVAVGCVGLVIFAMFAILIALVTGIWCNRAIADWAVERGGARHSLATAWRAVKTDLGRHVLIALAIMVVAMAGSTFFASFGMFAAFGESIGRSSTAMLMTLPIRFVGSILSSAFSALIASWYLASYGALAVEARK